MRKYLLNLAIALDQFINALFGGNPDETISSAVGRKDLDGRWWARLARPCIDWIFSLLGEEDHCYKSIEWCEFKTKYKDEIYQKLYK